MTYLRSYLGSVVAAVGFDACGKHASLLCQVTPDLSPQHVRPVVVHTISRADRNGCDLKKECHVPACRCLQDYLPFVVRAKESRALCSTSWALADPVAGLGLAERLT